MPDLPEISEDVMNAFFQAAHAAGCGAYISGGQGRLEVNDDQVRAGLAAALVASGYRREADVRAAIAYEIRAELVCCDIYERLSKERTERRWRTEQTKGHDLCYWGEAAARIAESHELRTLNGATALDPAQPLPVADGAEVDPVSAGTRTDHDGGRLDD